MIGYALRSGWKSSREAPRPKMAKRLKRTPLPRPKQREGAPRSRVPSLQGRETEIALIDQLLDRIDQGGSTLVISGEPGIGKSALLEAAKAGRVNAASPY